MNGNVRVERVSRKLCFSEIHAGEERDGATAAVHDAAARDGRDAASASSAATTRGAQTKVKHPTTIIILFEFFFLFNSTSSH